MRKLEEEDIMKKQAIALAMAALMAASRTG